ncbi:MAG: hypothetical protein NTW36_14685 [Planctomycetia bacterium]|jgi:hypothetical protein|nr:hypothetical protein [Planctomycetia bacterium]
MTDRITITSAAIVMLVCLAGAAAVAGVVQRQRHDLHLVVSTEGTEGMPPHVAIVTAALGTFRGLAVDLLWARAEHLQDQGEFFEAQTLSQWITTLQPRFQRVWAFQAWNLAYNLTAATQVPAERWGWVNRGIDLLRSRGIPLNPRAANLYFELAWIYQNKIGRVGDKEHWYYKARLAAEMQELLGDLTSGKTTNQAIERFRRISDAPATLDELERKTPDVRRALDMLAAHDAKPDEQMVRMLGRVLMFTNSLDAQLLSKTSLPPGTNRGLLDAMRTDKETATLLVEHLVPHLQKRVLEDRYRMNVAEMLRAMERYGPLDWRHPDAHGVYWSEQGVTVSRTLTRREDVNELLLIRSRLLMLMELMRSGRVEFDAATERVDLIPDPRFAKFYEQAIQEAFELIASDAGVSAAGFGDAEENDLFDAYEKFLNLATIFSYLYGDQAEAERYFITLRDLVTRRGYGDEPVYADTLENFVAIRFSGTVQVNLADLRQFLDAMIQRAIVEGLGKGDLKVFSRYIGVAHSVYDRRFASSRPGEKFVLEEAKLLEFPKLVENSFENVMKQNGLPVLTRARIWAWAPDKLRRTAYESLAETLRTEAEAAGLDPQRAFPPPPDDAQPAEGRNSTAAANADEAPGEQE